MGLIFTVGLFSLYAQDRPISLVYPRSNILLSTTDSLLVLGQIRIPNSKLYINDQFVAASHDGAFIGFVGIDPLKINADSTFVLKCKIVAKDSVYSFERKVIIPSPLPALDSATAAIDSNYLFPNIPISLRSGDRIHLKCRATPGAKVFYSVINSDGVIIESDQAMAEAEPDLMDNFGESVLGSVKRPNARGFPAYLPQIFS